MKEDLELLIKLQSIDDDIDELVNSKSYLPGMIKDLNQENETLAQELSQTEEAIKQLNLDKKRWEIEIGTWQSELEKFQKQMRDIKTNKEYDALMTEIEMRKQRISQNEDLMLQAMQELEEKTPQVDEIKKKLAKTEKENLQRVAELEEQIAGVDTKIEIKQDEKKRMTMQINKVLMANYDRVRKKCNPVVVSIRKKACGACHKSFPPQRIQEIRRGDGITTCDNCGRILIWSGDNEN